MKKNIKIIIALLALIIYSCTKESVNNGTSVHSSNSSSVFGNSALNGQDTEYLVSAAEGSTMEVILGKVAQTHSKNFGVKAFGLRMIQDHSQEHREIKSIANSKGVTVPDHPSADQQEEINEISQYWGASFDTEYISYEIWDHHQDISDGKTEAQHGNNREVKGIAAVWLPILVFHLEFAEWVGKEVHAPPYHDEADK